MPFAPDGAAGEHLLEAGWDLARVVQQIGQAYRVPESGQDAGGRGYPPGAPGHQVGCFQGRA